MDGQLRLERGLVALIAEFNASGDATVAIPAEYAEVVVFRKYGGRSHRSA